MVPGNALHINAKFALDTKRGQEAVLSYQLGLGKLDKEARDPLAGIEERGVGQVEV